jgi:hypothetical protein
LVTMGGITIRLRVLMDPIFPGFSRCSQNPINSP